MTTLERERLAIRARLVNWWRRLFPHPAAVTRRQESRRQTVGRAKQEETTARLRMEIAAGYVAHMRERSHG